MWCRECHKEVNVKSASVAGAACPVCGCTLVASSRQTDDIRRAYEILERWQSSDLFERINTTAPLATLKQQDRAPLLNIPLGKTPAPSPAPSPPPVEVPVNIASSVFREALPAPRNRVMLESLRLPVPSAEQMIWESLIAPRPLLAATAPSFNDGDEGSAAVVPTLLASGVSERRPPEPGLSKVVQAETTSSMATSSMATSAVTRSIAEDIPQVLPQSSSGSELDEAVINEAVINEAAIDAVITNAANYETNELLDNPRSADRAPESVQLSAAEQTNVDDDSVNGLTDDSLRSIVADQINSENDFSVDLQRENTVAIERGEILAPPEIASPEIAEPSEADPGAETKTSSHNVEADITDILNPIETRTLVEETASRNTAVAAMVNQETEFATLSNSLPADAPEYDSSGAGSVASLLSADSLQPVFPVLMSSTSIHEESATLQYISADSANDAKPQNVNATKKSQRAVMRRPPLHRRFQLERPVSESSAGSDTVTRKLRLDQTGGNAETPEASEAATPVSSSVAPETKIISNSPKPGRRFRIDQAQSIDETTGTAGQRSRTHGLPKQRFIDEAHETQLRGPHFEVTAPRRTNLTSMTGQFLAYLGVLGLTIGTAMVIYGHFGGYSEYTPTGWLVTTVAQMLLFLGVINLVSGGIEQNNEDVSRRINSLGEQLLRIEQVTSEVARGPKLPAHLYAEDHVPAEESEREAIAVDRR